MSGELASRNAPSWWRTFRELPGAVGALGRMVRDLAEDVRTVMATPAPVPSAFVAVLVVGTWEGKPVFLGRSADVEGTATIEVGPVMRPLDDVAIIVFCDLRRVDVRGIFAGVDLMQGALGECPVAKMHETLLPGIKVTVLCELRR